MLFLVEKKDLDWFSKEHLPIEVLGGGTGLELKTYGGGRVLKIPNSVMVFQILSGLHALHK